MHFYNNDKNKMHFSKKLETIDSFLNLVAEKNKELKNNLEENFLSKNTLNKAYSDESLLMEEIEKRVQKIIDDIIAKDGM